MSETSLDTIDLRELLERGRKGDREAREVLLRRAGQRLERMARGMLRRFPVIRSQVETGDVLQGSLLRLLRALEKVDPASTREFYGLAAAQMRRELLELARHYRSHPLLLARDLPSEREAEAGFDVIDEAGPERDLELWCAFHEAVEELPAAEREVFSLSFYHGWTQAQIAELLQLSTRQVRRDYNAALLALGDKLGPLPELMPPGGPGDPR